MARNLQRSVVQRESGTTDWDPRADTKVPELLHFTCVAHLSVSGQSLTEQVGWNTSLVTDGLAFSGTRWSGTAVPPGVIVTHGLIGASRSEGYWAVLYATPKQAQRLVMFGPDANSPGQTPWPTLTVGLKVSGLETRWPGLRGTPILPQARQWAAHPLMTSSSIVHRLLAIGVAPTSEITSKLRLLGRSTESMMGVPWFGFHQASSGLFVSEVSPTGDARSLGRADTSTINRMVERVWGMTPQLAASIEARSVRLPRSFDGFRDAVERIGDELLSRGSSELAGSRLPAISIEDRLNGVEGALRLLSTPRSVEDRLIGVSSSPPGTSLVRRLEPESGLVLLPTREETDVLSSDRAERRKMPPVGDPLLSLTDAEVEIASAVV